ncbi:MAG: cytochrome P450 [Hyphomonadaceae bacterium]
MADTAQTERDVTALKSYADIPLLDWDLLNPEFSSYDLFRKVREETPLAKVQMGMGTMVLGLRASMVDDIVSPENTRQLETEMKMMQGIFDGPIFDFIAQVMLFANGEAHQRRRQPVARTFAFKLMEAMRPKAAAVAAEIINEHIGKGPFDFLKDFAAQLPARIIADILGIPRADLPVFLHWISDTAESIGFVDVPRRADIEKSLVEFNAYVDKLLADRRANPRGDFLSEYVAATAASGDMSEGEIRAQVVGLILAGSDTTRNSMCMTLFELLQHPEQWKALCADPDGLKKMASEEGLRYQPVVSGIPRVTTRDLEIEGYLVPAGAVLAVSILSVLRDPAVYAEPESFNIHRTDQQRWHLAFGAGAHRCAGEALARVELEETLAAIARLAPNTRHVGPAPQLQPGAIRAVDQFQVEFIA